jgi:propionyl-CoA carboxylase beta chain
MCKTRQHEGRTKQTYGVDMTDDEETARSRLTRALDVKASVQDVNRSDAVRKQHDRGRLTARERIAYLCGSASFLEFGAIASGDSDPETPSGDGVIVGFAEVDGRHTVIVATDFTVEGGSPGHVGRAKLDRAFRQCLIHGLPLILLLESGGHRISEGQDSREYAFGGVELTRVAELSGWVPIAAAVLGPAMAGTAVWAMLANFTVMVRGKSYLGMAGPALVKSATGEDLDLESLGGADSQVDRNGLAHLKVETEQDALDSLRRFLSYFPANAQSPPSVLPVSDPIDRRCETLVDLVPTNSRKIYNSLPILREIADQGTLFPLKPDYARNLITALCRLGGRAVGMMVNQPNHLGGMLDSAACEKASDFISLCDAFGLPLISFVDVPGFAVGSRAEASGICRQAARMALELAHATVPRISVILRKGYGGGYVAMGGGRGNDADACFAWPTAEICAMSIEGSVDVALRRDYAAAPDPAARRTELIQEMRDRINSERAAGGFGIDDVIDPADTRRLLIQTLAHTRARRATSLLPPKVRPTSL